MIHLDTNVVIALIKASPLRVRDQFDRARTSGRGLSISTIVHHELMFGAANSNAKDRNEASVRAFLKGGVEIVPFDSDDAYESADIRAHLKRLGTPIGPYDILIAAQARRRGATLVTANSSEFERVAGLKVEDWS
jgi:tRNA(fMet)-specific endonuclease VapC